MDSTSFFVIANTSGVKPVFDAAFALAPISSSALDDVCVPFGGRPHERGLPAPGIGSVHIGAVKHELPHGFDASGAGRDHQRGLAVPSRRCRLRAGLEQSLHEHAVAVRCGERERRLAVFVDGIGLGARVEQRFGHRPLAEMDRPRKRRGAVGLRGVEVGLRANAAT